MGVGDLAKLESSLNTLLGEASWLLSHAQALADYGRKAEADAEVSRAVSCEERVVYLLDVAGREQEAVIHRVSAASCYERLGEHARAVTLLRAALSARLADDYRRRVEQQLARCFAQAPTRIGASCRQTQVGEYSSSLSGSRFGNAWRIILKKRSFSKCLFWRIKSMNIPSLPGCIWRKRESHYDY
jgi:hypothetical protein